MIEMGLDSIDAAIADGITLLRDLTVRTALLMYSMYSACPPLESLRAHHVGLLAPPGEAEALRTAIDAHGLQVVKVFPSAVVAAELAGRYRRPVHINVYCCRPAAGATQTLEIFHVTDGLNDAQIRAAITGVRHVAFSLAPGTDIQNLWKQMAAEGFRCVGGGTNGNDTGSGGGITVVYFSTSQCATLKLEIQIAGIHAMLVQGEYQGGVAPGSPTHRRWGTT